MPLDRYVRNLTRRRLEIPHGEQVISDLRAARHLVATVSAPARSWVHRIFKEELEIVSTPHRGMEHIDYTKFTQRVMRV